MLSVHKGGVSVEISCRRWPREKFIAQREHVLTGQGLDLEDAVKYQQALPEAKRSSRVLAAAREHGRTLVQVQAGAALLEDQGRLMRFLEQEGADCLSAGAEICLQHGRPDGEVLLYGVSLPVSRCRFPCSCATRFPTPAWQQKLPWPPALPISLVAASLLTYPLPRTCPWQRPLPIGSTWTGW